MSRCFFVVLLAAALTVTDSQIAVALEPGENCGPLRLTGLSDNAVEVKNFDQRPATALVAKSRRA